MSHKKISQVQAINVFLDSQSQLGSRWQNTVVTTKHMIQRWVTSTRHVCRGSMFWAYKTHLNLTGIFPILKSWQKLCLPLDLLVGSCTLADMTWLGPGTASAVSISYWSFDWGLGILCSAPVSTRRTWRMLSTCNIYIFIKFLFGGGRDKNINILLHHIVWYGLPLWSSGQSSLPQIQRSEFCSGTGSTQPREYNWGAISKKQQRLWSRNPRIRP
jgi:hypothetical protein